MNFQKFSYSYKKHGLIGFANTLFSKIGLKYRFNLPINKLILFLNNEVEKKSKNKILSGNYKNLYLEINKNWSKLDIASKYLGFYEQEVQNEIINNKKINKSKKKYFINLGAGDGYHSLGLLKKNLFNKSILYEMNKDGRNLIFKNAKKNKLSKKIIIKDKAEINFLDGLIHNKFNMKDCFFLFDIEGDEFKILNDQNIRKLKKSTLLIEIHHFYQNPNKLIKKLKVFFKLKFITTESRNLSKIKFLDKFHDIEKWLLVNEGRPSKMQWILCDPK